LSGFAAALLCFIWNIVKSGDILYSAFVSLCVLFAVSTVFLVALQAIAKVLFKHLSEKRTMQMQEMKRRMQEEAKEKAEQEAKAAKTASKTLNKQ
jgi:mannitol-specific phosphotransferase system IIBC component